MNSISNVTGVGSISIGSIQQIAKQDNSATELAREILDFVRSSEQFAAAGSEFIEIDPVTAPPSVRAKFIEFVKKMVSRIPQTAEIAEKARKLLEMMGAL